MTSASDYQKKKVTHTTLVQGALWEFGLNVK